jgi:hypothetical protein
MFWKETVRLRTMPVPTKIIISLFLILCGIGYLLGFANIYLTYSQVDEKPGLSLEDIKLTYYGARDKSTLEKAIDGSMKQYFTDDTEYSKVKDWVLDGASEKVWDSEIEQIFDASCNTCHSAETALADVVTVNYSDIKPLLSANSGKSWSRIVAVSHTHVLATAPLIFLLVLLLSFTSFPSIIKNVISIFAFSAVFIDIGSWTLAKLSPFFSIFVMIGGMSLGLAFGLLVLLPLYDLWIKKV